MSFVDCLKNSEFSGDTNECTLIPLLLRGVCVLGLHILKWIWCIYHSWDWFCLHAPKVPFKALLEGVYSVPAWLLNPSAAAPGTAGALRLSSAASTSWLLRPRYSQVLVCAHFLNFKLRIHWNKVCYSFLKFIQWNFIYETFYCNLEYRWF